MTAVLIHPDKSWSASPERRAKEMRPMRECPRYSSCSANICPLDPDWSIRGHVPGDEVCRWLLEAGKPGAVERFTAAQLGDLYEVARHSLPAICRRHADVARAVERARTTGSTFDRGANLVKARSAQQEDGE